MTTEKRSIMRRWLILIFMAANALFAQDHYFTFHIDDRDELHDLTRIISIDRVQDLTVTAYANEQEWQKFLALKIPYTSLALPSGDFKEKLASTMKTTSEWNIYPSYSAYNEMMQAYADSYPDICQLIEIGTTVNGRKLLALKISDNVAENETEPEFFYTSTMHGDETTGYILMLHLIDSLLTSYGSAERITRLVDNLEIYINPNANPDGTYYGGDNTLTGARRYNANGVDINRNFPDPQDGQHPDGHSWQPETTAMMDFAKAHHFIMSANFHGGTEVVNYPWDTWYTRHPDDEWYQNISHTYADAAQAASPGGYMDGYNDGITNGYDWYEVAGGRQDYMNYFHGCREVTIEISDTKLVPASTLPNYWNYNKESLLRYMEQALQGIHGTITDAVTGAPVSASISVAEITGTGSNIFNDLVNGDYTRPLLPGTYTVTVTPDSAIYPTPKFEDIIVSDNEVTSLDIELTKSEGIQYDLEVVGIKEIPDQSYLDLFDWGESNLTSLFQKVTFIVVNCTANTYSDTVRLTVYDQAYGYYMCSAQFDSVSKELYTRRDLLTIAPFDTVEISSDIMSGRYYPIYTFDGEITARLESSLDQNPDNNQIKARYLNKDNVYSDIFTFENGLSGWNFKGDSIWAISTEKVFFGQHSLKLGGDSLIGKVLMTLPRSNAYLYHDHFGGFSVFSFFQDYPYDTLLLGDTLHFYANKTMIFHYFPGDSIKLNHFDHVYYNNIGWNHLDTLKIEWCGYSGNSFYIDEFQFMATELTSHIEDINTLPEYLLLMPAYPNPFNPQTTLPYFLTQDGSVQINIYSVHGKQIDQYSVNNQYSGWHEFIWNGEDFPSGIYFIRVRAENTYAVRKVILLK